MRVRHRIPSIFNLSMVDVLCCALGCVILLWLLNLRMAKEHEDTAAEQSRQAGALLKKAQADRDTAYARIRDLEARLLALANERESLQKEVAARLVSARNLERRLKDTSEQMATLDFNLRASKKDAQAQMTRGNDLARKLADTLARLKDVQATADLVPGLRDDIKATQTRLKTAQATADLVPGLRKDLTAVRKRAEEEEALARALTKEVRQRLDELKQSGKSMEALQTTKRSLERDLAAREKELALARAYKDKWTSADERAEALSRRLTATDRRVAALEGEKKQLQGEVGRMRAVVDNRFAGIQLTGRRVVFLVDMSGSMNLVAEKETSATKWAGVRQTVVRLMRSLPDLDKYQVILFSDKVQFPMGSDGEWIDYNPKTSADAVTKKLAAVTPVGGTNMYAALQAAFRLRTEGLDTVYLLSDGLPNMGEGVAPAVAERMKELELGVLLGKHIRNTLKVQWNRPLAGRPRVRINSIGFFYESPDVGAFLWALSRENEGSFVGMSKP